MFALRNRFQNRHNRKKEPRTRQSEIPTKRTRNPIHKFPKRELHSTDKKRFLHNRPWIITEQTKKRKRAPIDHLNIILWTRS